MRTFITGATGYVGSVVVDELLAHGHTVIGLARSDAAASALLAKGAEVHRGNIEDLQSLRDGASKADAVIHLGFNHDFSKFAETCAHDALVIHALGAELAGTDKLFLVTSGTAILPSGTVSTEETKAPSGDNVHPRVATEKACAEIANNSVKVAVVRLSPSVHGEGDRGFVHFVADFARQNGASAYIDQGANRWCAVHRLDAAVLYRLALEKGDGGVNYHGVAEEGIPFKSIAATLGRSLDLPVVSKSGNDAMSHFDWFTYLAASNTPASSAWTREALGWEPVNPGLISDIEQGFYRVA